MSDALLDELRSLEVELHHPGVRCSRERLLQLLHPDFHEIGRSGTRYARDTIVAFLAAQSSPPDVVASHFSVRLITPDCAELTYRSAHRQRGGTLAMHAERSSLWLGGPSGWQLAFHQGTPCDPWQRPPLAGPAGTA